MFTPTNPTTERKRIRTEREYREWQLELWATQPVRRSKTGLSARLMNTLRRVAAL
jgi:hypothetical protein